MRVPTDVDQSLLDDPEEFDPEALIEGRFIDIEFEVDAHVGMGLRKMPGKQPFIVAMTAYAMDGDRDLCMDAGMDEYIRKPIKIEELQKVLERLGEEPGKLGE